MSDQYEIDIHAFTTDPHIPAEVAECEEISSHRLARYMRPVRMTATRDDRNLQRLSVGGFVSFPPPRLRVGEGGVMQRGTGSIQWETTHTTDAPHVTITVEFFEPSDQASARVGDAARAVVEQFDREAEEHMPSGRHVDDVLVTSGRAV